MHSHNRKPVERCSIEVFEDEEGNVCIQGSSRDLLELIHITMKSITEKEKTHMLVFGRKLFIHNKGE